MLASVWRPQSDGPSAQVEPRAAGRPEPRSCIRVKYATTRAGPARCAPPQCRAVPSKSSRLPKPNEIATPDPS